MNAPWWKSRRLVAAVWTCAALAAAGGMVANDGRVALGWERVLGPIGAAATNLPLWGLAVLAAWGADRAGRPVSASAVRLGAPLLVLGALWIPAIGALPRHEVPEATAEAPRGARVVLLTLDTFRADHLGAQNDRSARAKRDLTPRLDALAATGAVFTQAISPAPLTAPAHASMLTGLSPLDHGLVRNGQAMAEAQLPSVVAELRRAGWRTGAFVGSNVLDRDVGLGRGFEHYDDRWGVLARLGWIPPIARLEGPRMHRVRRGHLTVARALRWLAESDAATFLWVHLYDPHSPYLPPEGWQPSEEELAEAKAADLEAEERRDARGAAGGPLRAYQGRAWYRSEIRWTDQVAGDLVAGVGGDAAVLVVGDHGESLGEHDLFFTHGSALYDDVLRVPFVLRWPGRVPPGTRVHDQYATSRVAGMLRQLAGLTPFVPLAPDVQVAAYTSGQRAPPGRKAMKARQGGAAAEVGAAIRFPGGKVLAQGGEEPVFYDLTTDRMERTPLPVPPQLAEVEAAVRTMLGHEVPPAEHEERARLEALGYVE